MIGQDDPLLKSLQSELEQKEARKKHIERMMAELNNQKEITDKNKNTARNILIQLILYAYEIEKNILCYETSDKSEAAYIDVITKGFKQYYLIEEKLSQNQNFRDLVEIKIFQNKLNFDDAQRMIKDLLIKANEVIPGFKFKRATLAPEPQITATINQSSNEPQINNYSWGNSIYSLFAQCFGGGNSSNHGYVAPIELDNHPRQQAGNR